MTIIVTITTKYKFNIETKTVKRDRKMSALDTLADYSNASKF